MAEDNTPHPPYPPVIDNPKPKPVVPSPNNNSSGDGAGRPVDRLKRKVKDKSPDGQSSILDKTTRVGMSALKAVVTAPAKGAVMAARGGYNLGKGAASQFINGHWDESGLSNLFGPLSGLGSPIFSGKNKKKKLKGRSGISGGKIGKKFKEALAGTEQSLDGIDGSLATIANDIQKLQEINRRGFLSLLRELNSKAPNPFGQLGAARRQPKTIIIPKQEKKPESTLGKLGSSLAGMLGNLFGKSGILGGALTGLLGIAGNLAAVVRALTGATGTLLKFAAALAVPLGRGAVAVGNAIGRSLGVTGRSLRRGTAPTQATAVTPQRRASAGQSEPVRVPKVPEKAPAIPEAVKPKVADPKLSSLLPEPEAKPKPKATLVAPKVAETLNPKVPEKAPAIPEAVKPKSQPVAPKVADVDAKVTKALESVEGKKVQAPATPKVPEAKAEVKTPVVPEAKPAVETPKPTENIKPTAKLGGNLGQTLVKALGMPLAITLEAVEGYAEWEKAYEDFTADPPRITEKEYDAIQRTIIGKALGGLGGLWAGGALGASVGGAAGAPFAGIGAVPGSIIGGVVGGTAGYFTGRNQGKIAAKRLMEYINGEKAKPKEGATDGNSLASPPTVAPTVPSLDSSGMPKISSNEKSLPARQMIAGSERVAENRNKAPVIINAPNNTTNNNSSGGSGGSDNKFSPGNVGPAFSGLEYQSSGQSVKLLPD